MYHPIIYKLMAQPIHAFLKHIFGPATWQFTLLKNWNIIIGKLRNKVIIEKIYRDTIILGVTDSCWLQELYLLSPVLLNRINKTLDQPHIKQIRFKKHNAFKKKKVKKIYTPSQAEQCHLPSEKEEKILQTINNKELRKVLKKFLIRCYREREYEENCHNNTYPLDSSKSNKTSYCT